KEGLKSEPANPHLWAKLGWANWLLYGENEREETKWEAYRCSSNALYWNPKNAEAHLVQGVIGANLGDWPTATNHLLRAKEFTRTANGLVLVLLASACQSAKDRGSAKSYAELAEQAGTNSWDVFDRLGVFYYKSRS